MRLEMRLLGPPQIELNGAPASGFDSDKVRALLFYLAIEADRAHRRESLAGLLWPDYPERSARTNLSNALSNLRTALADRATDPSCFHISRETIQFNAESDHWLDVAALEEGTARGEWEAAADAWRGPFLEGFSLADSPEFEQWVLVQRERLQRQVMAALQELAAQCEAQSDLAGAIAAARRQLVIEAGSEEAHRALMRLLALDGQRTAALRQYRACVRVLEQELGVTPTAETTALYERIRAGGVPQVPEAPVEPASATAPLPTFLAEDEGAEAARPVFVARQAEVAQLERHLQAALAGDGQVVFVAGDAGRGKTALLGAFARRATDTCSDLLVAAGSCNAYAGLGDPYLPFREILRALSGDIGSGSAGVTNQEQARRLWQALPVVVDALVAHGDALWDTFVSRSALLSRAESAAPPGAPWLRRLQAQVREGRGEAGDLAQDQLLEQVTAVLRALAARHPLLLCLDDLQWVDAASASLLFHLGRRLEGSRILILAAYRPDEVALGRDGEPHPLEKIVAEFRRTYGEVWVDLREADAREGEAFVAAYLDSEPNRLGPGFRAALYARTGGHALFTVELLRAMQERGDLVQDEGGRWVEGPALHWEALPARVEGAIAARLGRLPPELRELLAVASVEGEVFTAQVVARVQGLGERELLRALSRDLERRHQLVQEEAVVRIDGRPLSRYRFAHALFQQALYQDLGQGERALLHGEVGAALEALYAGHTDEIVAPLAHHYAEAGQAEEAVAYLDRAGDRARLSYAHQEAIAHYARAASLLREIGDHDRAARTLMKLGLTYHNAYRFVEARQAYEEAFALWERTSRTLSAQALPPAPHALRLCGIWDAPDTLDPALTTDVSSRRIIANLFSGLVTLDRDENLVPDIAWRWEILEEGQRYVFYLRDDVCWSDGVPVTARDFEYTWKRTLDPATRSPRAEDFYPIRGARAYHQGAEPDPGRVGVRALDEHTLLLEAEDPTADLLPLAAEVAVPQHAVLAHGAAWTEPAHLVTDGPFRLIDGEQGRELILERSPAYQDRFTGNVERVQLYLCPEDGPDALTLYEQDRLDMLELDIYPPETQDRARQRHAADHRLVHLRHVTLMGLNVGRPPLDDRRVRRALVMAIDRERLAGVAYKGLQLPASGGFQPPGTIGYAPGIALPYDPARARHLLAEAGYPEGRGFPALKALTFESYHSRILTGFVQAQWLEYLGIDIPWQMVEWPEFVRRVWEPSAQRPEIWGDSISWAGREDIVLRVEGLCTSGWRNEKYERLREESQRVVDPDERLRICREADRILVEEAPAIPLLYWRQNVLIKPWVTRLPADMLEKPWLQEVVIEPH